MVREFVDRETGEILNIYSFRTVEQNERYKARSKGKKAKAFTLTNMENIREANELLTVSGLGYFLLLQTYIRYQDNVLVTSSHTNKPMNRGDIGKALGFKNRGVTKAYIDEFVDKGFLLYKDVEYQGKTVKAFSVNDEYHFKGATNNKKVVKTFSEQVRRLFAEAVQSKSRKKPENMGFLYLLLPYISYQNNVLCHNPFERDAEKIRPLSINDISTITGLHRTRVTDKINKLGWDGMSVFARVRKGSETHIKLNPFVFYRKNGEPDASLKADFKIKGSKGGRK